MLTTLQKLNKKQQEQYISQCLEQVFEEKSFKCKYKKQLTELKESYKRHDSHTIKFMFKYCKHNLQLTKEVFNSFKPMQFKQFFNEACTNSEQAQQFISELQEKLQEKNQIYKEFQKNFEKPKIKQDKPGFLQTLNEYFLISLFDYMDVRTLLKLGETCHYFHQITLKNQLYKKFTLLCYKNQSGFNFHTIFSGLEQFLNGNSTEYTPEILSVAKKDIREIVWGNNYLTNFQVKQSYYKKFGSWRSLYLHCPRVNFLGVYKRKEKYIKYGEKRLDQQHDPVILVEYYRYLRFGGEGKVWSIIHVKKLSPTDLFTIFDRAAEKQNDLLVEVEWKQAIKVEILIGEYQLRYNEIEARFVRSGTIFGLNATIRSSEDGMNDFLFLEKHWMKDVGDTREVDMNDEKRNQAELLKFFKFIRVPEFEKLKGPNEWSTFQI